MEFVKMHGLGNDFVVVGESQQVTAADVEAWCDRRRGIGADGVLRVSGGGEAVVRMEYWNADGSAAEMCGNGLRCVARYALDRGMTAGTSFPVATAVGERAVEVRPDGTVRALLGVPGDSPAAPFDLAGFAVEPVTIGNPHGVILVDDPFATPVEAVGPLVATDPNFPHGANVEFVSVPARDRLALRVWERGVGETLACGSGAAAATLVAHRRGLVGSRATVDLLGGPLVVEITDAGVWIEGPAEYVFTGSM